LPVSKRSLTLLRTAGLASLISEILIVVTGGLVRLTNSGLGCPTWPKCTSASYVTVPAQGWHGLVEFGNRLLTFALALIAVFSIVVAIQIGRKVRRGLVWPSLALFGGIVLQAVVGGISVLTKLNPWIVGLHFVVSASMIALATLFAWRIYAGEQTPVAKFENINSKLITVVGFVAVIFGIIVTGSGPHAGDDVAKRNGLDSELWQHIHSIPGYLLLALLLVQVILLRRRAGSARLFTGLLLVAVLLQATLGVVQARLALPIELVALHILGASIISALLTFQLLAIKKR
jgi:cytochrome c oxidase assembly protein subunit 15